MLTIFLELLIVFIFFLLWVNIQKSDWSPFVNKILIYTYMKMKFQIAETLKKE